MKRACENFLEMEKKRDEGDENPIWSLEVAEANHTNKTKDKHPQPHPPHIKIKRYFCLLKKQCTEMQTNTLTKRKNIVKMRTNEKNQKKSKKFKKKY